MADESLTEEMDRLAATLNMIREDMEGLLADTIPHFGIFVFSVVDTPDSFVALSATPSVDGELKLPENPTEAIMVLNGLAYRMMGVVANINDKSAEILAQVRQRAKTNGDGQTDGD